MISNLTLVNLLVKNFEKKIMRKEVKSFCYKELKMNKEKKKRKRRNKKEKRKEKRKKKKKEKKKYIDI